MARLDIRVDGRTRFSRTVDDAVIARVLAATEEPKRVKRAFGGKVVRELPEPVRRKPVKKVGDEVSADIEVAQA